MSGKDSDSDSDDSDDSDDGYKYTAIVLGFLVFFLLCVLIYYWRHKYQCNQRRLAMMRRTTNREGSDMLELRSQLVSLQRYYLDEFSTKEVLGQGSFSQVHLMTRKSDGQLVAGKFFIKNVTSDVDFLKEVNLLHTSTIDCRFIVDVIGIVNQPKVLLMEYLKNGSLDGVLTKDLEMSDKDGYSEYPIKKRLSFIMDMVRAVNHLHKQNVVHRDLASRNLLVSDDKEYCLLADFTLARNVKNIQSQLNYTLSQVVPRTSAPETLTGEKRIVSMGSDIWSLAITMSEIINKRTMASLRGDHCENLGTFINSPSVTSSIGDCSIFASARSSEPPFLKPLLGSVAVYPGRLFHVDMHIDPSVFNRSTDLWALMLRCLHRDVEDRPSIWEVECILKTIIENPTSTTTTEGEYFVPKELELSAVESDNRRQDSMIFLERESSWLRPQSKLVLVSVSGESVSMDKQPQRSELQSQRSELQSQMSEL